MPPKHQIDPDAQTLDAEEQALLEALEAGIEQGALVSHLTPERHEELRSAARATMNPRKKPISVRLPERDLEKLKARALAEGIPYQTLLASIVHRYVEGTLVNRD